MQAKGMEEQDFGVMKRLLGGVVLDSELWAMRLAKISPVKQLNLMASLIAPLDPRGPTTVIKPPSVICQNFSHDPRSACLDLLNV